MMDVVAAIFLVVVVFLLVFAATSKTNKQTKKQTKKQSPTITLSPNQRLQVLNYVNTHKEFIFGKQYKGVSRQTQNAARESFLEWCKGCSLSD